VDIKKVEQCVRDILVQIGEDPEREGLRLTPRRVAEAYRYLTSGYHMNAEQLINNAIFQSETDNMVIARDIDFYSLCEHHLLPIYGRCHVGYIPENGRVLGLSKLARLVDMYSRRLQLQERMTEQIAHSIMNELKPEGVGVVVEAHHLCMMMRGPEKQNSLMTTSSVLGSFHDSVATRSEFLTLIGRPRI
jgi:GTP cyclohydrolase IA